MLKCLRVADDRFVLKELSRLEMDALLRFAPAYFEYMSKAIFHGVCNLVIPSILQSDLTLRQVPTLLAKIFGFYRIGLRNTATGKTMRIDVLLMENLFYERKFDRIYDLKGSTRNRHVQVNKDKPLEVILDENLIEGELKYSRY